MTNAKKEARKLICCSPTGSCNRDAYRTYVPRDVTIAAMKRKVLTHSEVHTRHLNTRRLTVLCLVFMAPVTPETSLPHGCVRQIYQSIYKTHYNTHVYSAAQWPNLQLRSNEHQRSWKFRQCVVFVPQQRKPQTPLTSSKLYTHTVLLPAPADTSQGLRASGGFVYTSDLHESTHATRRLVCVREVCVSALCDGGRSAPCARLCASQARRHVPGPVTVVTHTLETQGTNWDALQSELVAVVK